MPILNVFCLTTNIKTFFFFLSIFAPKPIDNKDNIDVVLFYWKYITKYLLSHLFINNK